MSNPVLTPEQLKCNHLYEDREGAHAFDWPEPGKPRNVWNPFHPICTRCGASMGSIVEHLNAKREGDSVLGPWVYCAQHLRAHRSGWCTVDNADKVGLGEFPGTEQEQGLAAIRKCRLLGLKLFEDVRS